VNRRKFIKLSAMTAGAVFGGRLLTACEKTAGTGSKKAVSDAAVKSMDMNVTYVTEVINRPKLGEKIELWVPLVQDDHGQEVIRTSIDSPVTYSINTDDR
jgi:hypothetical protein